MPWVRFTEDFDWKPSPQVTVAFRAGSEKLVTTPCASAAVAARKAQKMPQKRKGTGDGLERTAK